MNTFILSIVFSTIGIYYIAHGKKVNSIYFMLSGLVLLLYTYFITGLWTTIIIGCAFCAVPFIFE
jgi:hypothetical protein